MNYNHGYMTWYSVINEISTQIIDVLNNVQIYPNSSIIFDIDDTLIHSVGGPILPIVNVWNHAKSMGLSIIVITNRIGTSENIELTRRQLLEYNITGYKLLFFRSPYIEDNPIRFKDNARLCVYERGYSTIMSIGDQLWDFGDHGGIGVQVPVL